MNFFLVEQIISRNSCCMTNFVDMLEILILDQLNDYFVLICFE